MHAAIKHDLITTSLKNKNKENFNAPSAILRPKSFTSVLAQNNKAQQAVSNSFV